MKQQPPAHVVDFCTFHNPKGDGLAHFGFDPVARELQDWFAVCPYGQVGDRLWVREAWRTSKVADELKPSNLAGGGHSPIWHEAQDDVPCHPSDFGKLRPSMFMPRWASRITLEITRVRVERLQDITEADARAEGCAPAWLDAYDHTTVHAHAQPTYKRGYARLWGEINGDVSWDANPWVWVLSFTVVQP